MRWGPGRSRKAELGPHRGAEVCRRLQRLPKPSNRSPLILRDGSTKTTTAPSTLFPAKGPFSRCTTTPSISRRWRSSAGRAGRSLNKPRNRRPRTRHSRPRIRPPTHSRPRSRPRNKRPNRRRRVPERQRHDPDARLRIQSTGRDRESRDRRLPGQMWAGGHDTVPPPTTRASIPGCSGQNNPKRLSSINRARMPTTARYMGDPAVMACQELSPSFRNRGVSCGD